MRLALSLEKENMAGYVATGTKARRDHLPEDELILTDHVCCVCDCERLLSTI